MADRLPDCVIVSSNRFYDIAPYASHIYHANPKVWGSVFPWEMPQDGTREQEERFLRDFFSETEIHMQGFRFLKQAWYANALWNLNQRVPAVEKWFWEEGDGMALLKDSNMKGFFLKRDVGPSTFFDAQQLQMYSEKFLSVVVPCIQHTARTMLEPHQPEKTAEAASSTANTSPAVTSDLKAYVDTSSGSSDRHTMETLPTSNQQPHTVNSALTVHRPSHIAPASTTDIDLAKCGRIDAGVPADPQVHLPKRGNSLNKRFTNRGGHLQGRQPHDRGPQSYPSSMYRASMPTSVQQRAISGGGVDFMSSGSQGSPILGMMPQMHSVHPHSMHTDRMAQAAQGPLGQFQSGQTPIYYNANAFVNHGNDQLLEFTSSRDPMMMGANDIYDSHRGARRNSQGTRGRFNGGRGRGRGHGSRGRNSFTAADQPPYIPRGEQSNAMASSEYNGVAFHPKHRRSSVLEEPNWRSGNGHFKSQTDRSTQKENVAPNRAFSGPAYHPMQHMAGSGLPSNARPQYYSQSAYFPTRDSPGVNTSGPNSFGVRQACPDDFEAESMRLATLCSKEWISPDCQHVTKLIVFNIPRMVPEPEIEALLRRYGDVSSIRRAQAKFAPVKDDETIPVFISFKNTTAAREFLDTRPHAGFDGGPLSIQVAREYWDSGHRLFQSRVQSDSATLANIDAARRSTTTKDTALASTMRYQPGYDLSQPSHAVAETVTRDQRPCDDITPTPSAASTPKSSNGTKKAKKKNKKLTDLRQASYTSRVDSPTVVGKNDMDSDVDSVVTASNNGQDTKDDTATGALTSPGLSGTQKEASTRVQIDQETSLQPSLTPKELSKAHLALPDAAPPVQENENQPKTIEAESQPATTLATTKAEVPKNSTSLDVEDESQPFLGGEEEAEKTQAIEVKSNAQSEAPVIPAETVAELRLEEDHLDDSFRTASDSPGGDKTAECGRVLDDQNRESTSVSMSSTENGAASSVSKVGDVAADQEQAIPVSHGQKENMSPHAQKPKVTISISSYNVGPNDSSPGKRTISGSSIVPPTPGFVTAPNTPAVMQNEVEDEQPKGLAVPEKVDKTKGPAQTESLSLFGKKKKKQEKKPRPAKKGTLKSKPNANEQSKSEVMSESSSQVVSGATTPTADSFQHNNNAHGPKHDGGNDKKVNGMHQSRPNKSSCKEDACKTALEEKEKSMVHQQDTPSKKRGNFGNIISSIFSAGQNAQPNTINALPIDAVKNSLTGSKAQDHPLEIETKTRNECGNDMRPVDATEEPAVDNTPSPAVLGQDEESFAPADKGSLMIQHDTPVVPHDPAEGSDVGLGISNITLEQSLQDVAKIKKRKKKQRKDHESMTNNDASDQPTQVQSPGTLGNIYRFGTNDPTPTEQVIDCSSTSSHTEPGDTPSPETSPLSVSTPARKLPAKASASGHILEAKQPSWMLKKRISSARVPETVIVSDRDNKSLLEILNANGSEEASEDGLDTPPPEQRRKEPKRLYVYIEGEGDQGSRVIESKEKLQALVREEVKRKYDNPPSSD